MKVAALVVTYNRIDLLKECIKALINQSEKVNDIIIIDNDSIDGTREYLSQINDESFHIKLLNKNVGGSGGFFEGISFFQRQLNDDYIWIMDDDTIPERDALSKLKNAANYVGSFGFLASNVRWIDGEPSAVNIPAINSSKWTYTVNSNKDEFYPILSSASFVSILIPKKIIDKVGMPIKEFFIWGDDVEYTLRISKRNLSYYVPYSIVVHKIKNNKSMSIINEDGSRIDRYFYDVRNKMFRARELGFKDGFKMRMGLVLNFFLILFKKGVHKRLRKLWIIFKGISCGIFFRPKIVYINSKKSNSLGD